VFEFTGLAAVLAVAGIAYLMLVGRWLLPREIATDRVDKAEVGKYLAELRITQASLLVGKNISEMRLGEHYGVYPLELQRGERHMWSPRSQQLKSDDVLLVRGDWAKIEEFQRQAHLENVQDSRYANDPEHPRILAEIMVAPASIAEHHRLTATSLGRRPDIAILAIHRRGQVLREKLRDVRLAVGDVLLVAMNEDVVAQLRGDDAWVVLSERAESRSTPRKAIVAATIMVGVVVI
jgi:uncharacterized protein with PhoU and TrkA domain